MWRRWLAAFGAVVLMAAALAAEWWWLPPEGYPQRYGYTDAQYQPIGSLLIQLIITGWDGFRSWFDHDSITTLAIVATAIFTGTLWRATSRLWKISQIHASHMEQSVGVAEKAAIAAQRSADIAELSLTALQRPFITSKGITAQRTVDAVGTVTWVLSHEWENSGATPTRFGFAHTSWSNDQWTEPMQPDWDFRDFGGKGYNPVLIGPKVRVNTPAVTFTADDLIAIQEGRRFFYMWGWMSYGDIFDTRSHITRFAYHLAAVLGNIRAEPSPTNPIGFAFRPLPRHNCADEECENEIYAGGPEVC